MKEGPEFKIIGNINEQEKEIVQDLYNARLHNHLERLSEFVRKDLTEFELPKNEKQIRIQDRINIVTNEVLEDVGAIPFAVSEDNVHLMDRSFFEKMGTKSNGFADFDKQIIFLNSEGVSKGDIYFAEVLLHEVLHMKSFMVYQAAAVRTEANVRLSVGHYRSGISVHSSKKKRDEGQDYTLFIGLHEAIVQTETINGLKKIFLDDEFHSEKELFASQKLKDDKKEIAEKFNLDDEELFPVDAEKNKFEIFGYKKQREVLSFLCESIYNRMSQKFKNTDSVYHEFKKAQFKGDLMPVARLVEEVFGKGSFRILGNMTEDKESAKECLDFLKKSLNKQS